MNYTGSMRVPKQQLDYLNAILKGETPYETKDGECIHTFTFGLSRGWEADIKLVAGDPTPYVEAVLFCEGVEHARQMPRFDHIDGEYVFEVPSIGKFAVMILSDCDDVNQNDGAFDSFIETTAALAIREWENRGGRKIQPNGREEGFLKDLLRDFFSDVKDST
jgi:hypothetical protein